MKIFFLIVFLVGLLTLLESVNTQDINQEYILNYLNDSFSNIKPDSGVVGVGWIIDSYDILGVNIPNRDKAIQLFNSQQNDSGCWFEKKNHYVPWTVELLMVYNRTGVKPAKSLDPFFSTIDTWEEVKADVLKYDGGNYWGGLWGYVTSYIVYKGEAPPWTPEFLNETIKKFDSWAYDSHQRTHLVMNLYMLNLSVPRVDEVVLATLNDQRSDGSWHWGSATYILRETVFNIFMLGFLRDQTSVDKSLIDSAITRGTEYVKSCYRTVDANGKTYGYFSYNSTVQNPEPQSTALGILTFLNPQNDVWSRWFALPIINKTEVDNSLEHLRPENLEDFGVHNTALYVFSKSLLETEIPNKQEIINYFDNNQNQTDGSWSDVNTPMFTTNRVLTAYFILGATPKKSLDPYFQSHDTWEEAKIYMLSKGSGDARNMYHLIYAWVLYYREYPPWMNDFFNYVETGGLSWTINTESHKRTHIIYSYVIARRQFPNLDGMIDETIREQLPDGNWSQNCLSTARPIYCTSIQLSLLQEIIKLYPNYRTAEIQSSIDRSKSWLLSNYNAATVNDVVMGYFGYPYENIENSLMTGIMAAGVNGLMDANVDMTFEDLVQSMKKPVILTNKLNYNPGETVQITGTNFSSEVDASLQINDPNDVIKFVDQTQTNSNGDFSSNYIIPSKATTDSYTIYASSPNEFAQVSFNILGASTTTTTTTITSTTTTSSSTSTSTSASSSTTTSAFTTSTTTSSSTTTTYTCVGTIALNCQIPQPGSGNERLWGYVDCTRSNAEIDCDGKPIGSHYVCQDSVAGPCTLIEPSISSYSVNPTSIEVGQSFSISVAGFCPSILPGRCLVECRAIHPDGHFIEVDTWDEDGSSIMPSVNCNQAGVYTVDYCVVKTDFAVNSGWGNSYPTDTQIICNQPTSTSTSTTSTSTSTTSVTTLPVIDITCTGPTSHYCSIAYKSIDSINSITAPDSTNCGDTISVTVDWTGYHNYNYNHWGFFIDSVYADSCKSLVSDSGTNHYMMSCNVKMPAVGTVANGAHTFTVTGEDYNGYCNPGENGVDAQISKSIMLNNCQSGSSTTTTTSGSTTTSTSTSITTTTSTTSTTSTTIPGNTETKLYLNGTEGNFYYLNNTYANFTVWVNVSGNVYLNTNITSWTIMHGSSPFTQIVQLNATQNSTHYNITGYFLGDITHDSSSQTNYAIIYVTTTTTATTSPTTSPTTTTHGSVPTTSTISSTTTLKTTTSRASSTTSIKTTTTEGGGGGGGGGGIPSKTGIPKQVLIIGVGILIILTSVSLVIILKSVHWGIGKELKILIILIFLIVSISLLISLLPIREMKGIRGLSILDWLHSLWEWITGGPKEAAIYNFFVSAQILDSNHNPTSYILPGQKYYINASIRNDWQETKSAKFIVQIKDSIGQVIDDINQLDVQLDTGQTKYFEVSYTAPDVIGKYVAQIFIWTDLASQRGFALAAPWNLDFEVVSQITSTTITTTTIPITTTTIPIEEINREHILNYLNYSLEHPSDIGNFIFTLDSYELLNEPIPNRAQVIEYLNSKQNLTEGTWNTGRWHYVPITAQVLMFYNRSGVIPPISLEPFFKTVDTWEEVDAHVKFYDSDKLPGGWNNYWGGLWGYVTSYVVYKHEAPPWTPEFLNEAIKNFDSWAYSSHQRTHLVGSLGLLGLPIPRVDEVVTITLQQQKVDGSWDYHEAETVFNINVLGFLRDQTSVDKSLIDSAITRGTEYVKSCYRTVDANGKTYGLFVKNSTVICSSSCLTSSFSWYTAQGIFAVLNPTSDIWTRWIVNKNNLLQNEIDHIDNSLEYLRWNVSLGVHDMAEYVISKSYLGTQIPNKQQIIDYFDNTQGANGSWSDAWTPMFTTHRVLLAYYILNATPKHSLDSFFSKYDTWTKAQDYIIKETKTDLRDVYHITFGWSLYHILSGWDSSYPPWLDTYFSEVEKDLTWTTSTNSHKRTHILYNYVITRRQFPNLDGIIDETLREQSPDGNWISQCLSPAKPIYCTSIQLALLQEIIKLHPNYRTAEIQNSIDRSRQWVYNSYNTTTVNGVVMGRFGTPPYIEDAFLTGIMSAGINGLMDINVDMTFEDLFKNLKTKSHSEIFDMPVYPDDTVPKHLLGYSLDFIWYPFMSATCKDENNNLLLIDISIRPGTADYKVNTSGRTYSTSANPSVTNYDNGVLTIGTMPKIIIDYHTPHKITAYYTPTQYFNITVTYRGPPLWYSKLVDESDMCPVNQYLKFGGYDAPSEIEGIIYNNGQITPFSGYGDWEHVWLLGDWSTWDNSHELWMYFNDENSYGVIVESKHPETGELLTKTGRLWSQGQTYTFDDFTWKDDGKTGYPIPKLINITGPAKDLLGNVKKDVNIETIPEESFEPFGHPMWMFHRLTGTVNGLNFDGYSHAEVRRIFPYPTIKAAIATTSTTSIISPTSTTTTTISASSTTTTIPVFQPLLSLSNDESTLYDVVDGKLYFAYFGYNPPSGLMKLDTSTNEAVLIGEDKVYRWTAWKGFYDENDQKLWFAGEYEDPAAPRTFKGTVFQYDPITNKANFVRHPTALEAWGIISYPPYLAYGQISNNVMYAVPKSTWTDVSTWLKKDVPYSGAIDFGYWKGKLYGIIVDSSDGKIKIFDAVTIAEKSSFANLLSSGSSKILFTSDKVSVITVEINKQVWLHETNDMISWTHKTLDIPFSLLKTKEVYRFNLLQLNGKLVIFKAITTWEQYSTDGTTEIYSYDGSNTRKIGSLEGYTYTKPIVYNNILYLATCYSNYVYKIPISELNL